MVKNLIQPQSLEFSGKKDTSPPHLTAVLGQPVPHNTKLQQLNKEQGTQNPDKYSLACNNPRPPNHGKHRKVRRKLLSSRGLERPPHRRVHRERPPPTARHHQPLWWDHSSNSNSNNNNWSDKIKTSTNTTINHKISTVKTTRVGTAVGTEAWVA